MAGITTRRVVVALDCPDARELAEFYASMLGWRTHDDAAYPDWVDVLPPEGEPDAIARACQTVPDFRADLARRADPHAGAPRLLRGLDQRRRARRPRRRRPPTRSPAQPRRAFVV